MPATITGSPAGIRCVFSNGTGHHFRFGDTGDPALAGDLLTGLGMLIHPHGPVDSANTVRQYMSALRHLAAAVTQGGPVGGAGKLTRAALAQYWMGLAHPDEEGAARRVLAALDTGAGVLGPRVADLVRGRPFCPKRTRDSRPFQPYSLAERDRLASCCRQVITESSAGFRAAARAARRGTDPRQDGWTSGNLHWLLARLGPVSVPHLARLSGLGTAVLGDQLGAGRVRRALFPGTGIVIAYRVLFGFYTGIVPDGIDGLGLGDLDWAGDEAVVAGYVKGRTARESLALPARAARLLDRWLEHSVLLRRHAPQELRDRLWLWRSDNNGAAIHGGRPSRLAVTTWVRRHELTGDDGQPLRLHLHRIRTTFESHRDRRAWFGSGRATIDPNHSPQVEGDHYLSALTPGQRQAVDTLIEDAQHDLLRKAATPQIITSDQAAELAARFPELLARHGLDDAAAAELAAGARDVFVAACADHLAGAAGPAGKPCPARPWVCLLCPLAVFAPRHAANMLRLKAFFARQWRAMPAAQFMAVFGPYARRADEVLAALGRLDPALIARASAGIAGCDRDLPLRPEELTTPPPGPGGAR
jgi:hypothetical protein